LRWGNDANEWFRKGEGVQKKEVSNGMTEKTEKIRKGRLELAF